MKLHDSSLLLLSTECSSFHRPLCPLRWSHCPHHPPCRPRRPRHRKLCGRHLAAPCRARTCPGLVVAAGADACRSRRSLEQSTRPEKSPPARLWPIYVGRKKSR